MMETSYFILHSIRRAPNCIVRPANQMGIRGRHSDNPKNSWPDLHNKIFLITSWQWQPAWPGQSIKHTTATFSPQEETEPTKPFTFKPFIRHFNKGVLFWGLILQCFVLYQSLSLIKKIERSFSWKVTTKETFNRNNNNMINMTIKITPIKTGRREEGALSICMTYLILCIYFYNYGLPGFLHKYYLDKKTQNI